MSHEDKNRDDLFTGPEEIVTFAQAYYATEFPNDERRDCPTLETLRKAARSGVLPDAHLRSHLFDCSECFRAYRGAGMARHARVPSAGQRRDRLGATLISLRSPWAQVAAGASALILLGSVTATLLRHSRTDLPAVAVKYSPQGFPAATLPEAVVPEAASATPVQEPSRPDSDRRVLKPSPRAPKASPKNRRTLPPLRVVYVDLKEDDLLRGDDEAGTERRLIRLTRERQRIRLRMPRGSAPGRYTVRVVDAFGKPLLTTAARSGGRTLTVDLDLRGLAARLYRLCLSRDGEAPDCYLMSVGENPTPP